MKKEKKRHRRQKSKKLRIVDDGDVEDDHDVNCDLAEDVDHRVR